MGQVHATQDQLNAMALKCEETGQSVAQGATPQIRAAVEPGLAGGTYLGPQGPFEMHGTPGVVHPPKPALDPELATGLWELSEKATGVSFP